MNPPFSYSNCLIICKKAALSFFINWMLTRRAACVCVCVVRWRLQAGARALRPAFCVSG